MAFMGYMCPPVDVWVVLKSEGDRRWSCTLVSKCKIISVMFCIFFYPLCVSVKKGGNSLSESPATVCHNGSSQVSVSFLTCSYLLHEQWCNIFVLGLITQRHRFFSLLRWSRLKNKRLFCVAQPLDALNFSKMWIHLKTISKMYWKNSMYAVTTYCIVK